MGPTLGAVSDGRRIATEFDRTVHCLFGWAFRVRKVAELARTYEQRRKSNRRQVELAVWLLLVSCVGEPEFSTTTAIPFLRQSISPRVLKPDPDGNGSN